MKRFYIISTLFILIITFFSCASSTKAVEVKIEKISKTINVESTKNELYLKANDWMISTFKDAESVIQFTDKESGIITGKYLMGKSLVPIGNSHTFSPSYENVFAIIKIQVKEKAARITITPNSYKNGTITIAGKTDEGYKKENAIKEINTLIEMFSEYLKNKNDDF